MDDDSPEVFFFDYPVWIVAPRGQLELAESGRGEVTGGNVEGGGRYVAIFTDRDLAERSIDPSGISSRELSVGEIPNSVSYLHFLKRVQKAGFTYLAIDPSGSSSRCKLVTVDAAITDIQEQQNESEEDPQQS